MSTTSPPLTDVEQVWRNKTDEELARAALSLADYTASGERVIRAELLRRGLEAPPPVPRLPEPIIESERHWHWTVLSWLGFRSIEPASDSLIMVVILGAIGSALVIFSTEALLRGLCAFVLFGAVIRLVALLYCIWTGSPTGCSRLTGAIVLRKPDQVRELVNGGYDVNVRERDGRTPLFAAIETRQKEIIQVLLEHGANADVRSHDLSTPLHLACAACDVATTELLLARNADVNARTLAGETPLHVMGRASGDDEVESRYFQVARMLVNAGAEVTAADNDGSTALHYAVAVGSTEPLQLLLEHGADINAQIWNGATPLATALLRTTTFPAIDGLKFLIERGADVNAKFSDGGTLLFLAALNTSTVEPAKALIAAGAVVTAASANGSTALHEAAREGTLEMVALLLSHGASPQARDQQGSRPLDVAGDKKKREILKKAMDRSL